ncbi:hypothetical protein C8R44DRAFT_892774 [Mycena epipterygia]|nr:hypothetical protein C8R44DRAFT_892774 [Mycena epipterygia]
MNLEVDLLVLGMLSELGASLTVPLMELAHVQRATDLQARPLELRELSDTACRALPSLFIGNLNPDASLRPQARAPIALDGDHLGGVYLKTYLKTVHELAGVGDPAHL